MGPETPKAQLAVDATPVLSYSRQRPRADLRLWAEASLVLGIIGLLIILPWFCDYFFGLRLPAWMENGALFALLAPVFSVGGIMAAVGVILGRQGTGLAIWGLAISATGLTAFFEVIRNWPVC
jgi:hypothetical protein